MSALSEDSGHAREGGQNSLSFRVNLNFNGKRLDLFLAYELAERGISRQKIKRLIADGNAAIDGAAVTQPKQTVFSGQTVQLALLPAEADSPQAQKGNLSILYRGKDFLVLDKPPHLTVHPCPSCPNDTLVNILLHHFPELGQTPGLRPGIVHRLDKDTSGLLVVALNEAARLKLAEAFARRAVEKEYLALVMGVPESQAGVINQPLGRHPTLKTRMAVVPHGKEALSEYRSLFRVAGSGPENRAHKANNAGAFSLLAVKIHTGRTHQIRVHLAHIGHPIWGDSLYGGAKYIHPDTNRSGPTMPPRGERFKIADRQMLHAWKLQFDHPETGQRLRFQSSPPPDFLNAIKSLLAAPLKVILTGLPGCGKSSLLEELGELGLPVWSADAEVDSLYSPGKDGWLLIRRRFGGRFIGGDGGLNKRELFAAMRAEPGLRHEVEDLIHPLAGHRLSEFWKNPGKGGSFAGGQFISLAPDSDVPGPAASISAAPASVAEVPLFLEAGWSRGAFDWKDIWRETCARINSAAIALNPNSTPGGVILVYVDTSAKLRYERLAAKGVNAEQAAALDSWQWPEISKRGACDIVVDNNGSRARLKNTAKELMRILLELSLIRNDLASSLALSRIE